MFDLSKAQIRARYMKFFFDWYLKEEVPTLEKANDGYQVLRTRNSEFDPVHSEGIQYTGYKIDKLLPASLQIDIQIPRNYWRGSAEYSIYIPENATKREICGWILGYTGYTETWRSDTARAINRIVNDFFEVEHLLAGYDKKFDTIEPGVRLI